MYTSLFKKSDVRVTTKYSSTHRGIDLSRGVVEQPIYFPNKAVSGTVWKILAGYTYNGKYYANSPIIYIKHQDGSGSRYIHSYTKNVKVKVGDKVVAGQQVCATGNSGYSFGDHLHFEWLTKWDDLNTRVNPEPFVIEDKIVLLKVGQKLEFIEKMNLRDSANGKDIGDISKGAVGEITEVSTFSNGYQWYGIKFGDAKGYVADTNFNKVTTKNMTNLSGGAVIVLPCEEYQNEIERLEGIIRGLTEALGASQASEKVLGERVEFLEGTLAIREKELSDLEND